MAFMAFEIMLEDSPGILNTDADGFVNIKDARLKLIFNEQNPNPAPDHAYNLAYPETAISSQEDIVILHDEEKARLAFEAWCEGVPLSMMMSRGPIHSTKRRASMNFNRSLMTTWHDEAHPRQP